MSSLQFGLQTKDKTEIFMSLLCIRVLHKVTKSKKIHEKTNRRHGHLIYKRIFSLERQVVYTHTCIDKCHQVLFLNAHKYNIQHTHTGIRCVMCTTDTFYKSIIL